MLATFMYQLIYVVYFLTMYPDNLKNAMLNFMNCKNLRKSQPTKLSVHPANVSREIEELEDEHEELKKE